MQEEIDQALEFLTPDEIKRAYCRVMDMLLKYRLEVKDLTMRNSEMYQRAAKAENQVIAMESNIQSLKRGQNKLAELIGEKEKEIRSLKQSISIREGLARKRGK